MICNNNIRNVAIIAHVDHGKTTLIDSMFKQSGIFRSNQDFSERIMDNNDLEKERGITICAKCTSINFKDKRINIIDTPGHADFGGEVERILSMVDGALLLVDSSEGVMPQTKFVLGKALALKLKIVVVINKIDKREARPDEVINEILELFMELEADDDQINFPVLYAAGRDGWSVKELTDERKDLQTLFNTIIDDMPVPSFDETIEEGSVFKMLVTLLDYDKFLGRILIGKVQSGNIKIGENIHAINQKKEIIESGKLTKLYSFDGVKRVPVESATLGDIIAVAGLGKASVSDTISEISALSPIQSTPVTPPTISIYIGVNTSPLVGRDGDKVTSNLIWERLYKESESNVAIDLEKSESESFKLCARGELQCGIIVESMRREGYEMSVSKPKVILKKENNKTFEPIEEVTIDVDNEYSGIVIDKMTRRKALMKDMIAGNTRTRIKFNCPSRALIGYHGEFLTDTKGTGILNKMFVGYEEFKGSITTRNRGVLIASEPGLSSSYAINNLQERGEMIIGPQQEVYAGMIIGIHAKDTDLLVNVTKSKQLANMRAAGSDDLIKLAPPKKMTLEDMIAFIEDDELVEVTPKSIRIRKKYLTPSERKKMTGSKV